MSIHDIKQPLAGQHMTTGPSLGDISRCPSPGCPRNKSDFFSLNPLNTKFCHSNLPRYILAYLGGRLSCLSMSIREIKRPLAGRPMTLGPRCGDISYWPSPGAFRINPTSSAWNPLNTTYYRLNHSCCIFIYLACRFSWLSMFIRENKLASRLPAGPRWAALLVLHLLIGLWINPTSSSLNRLNTKFSHSNHLRYIFT